MEPQEAQDWRHRAVCRDEDPEVFFPVSDEGPGKRQEQQAKRVCARCPVRPECRAWALETVLAYGVAGGMSEQERRALLRRPPVPKPIPRSRRGQPTALTDGDVEEILARLDAGVRPDEVGREMGIGAEVCRRVWRRNRSSLNPPGRKAAGVVSTA